jgi:hypothetical protein
MPVVSSIVLPRESLIQKSAARQKKRPRAARPFLPIRDWHHAIGIMPRRILR